MAAPSMDHPRSRGEYRRYAADLIAQAGSSPLSRGIPSVTNSGSDMWRIIPALAGNTEFNVAEKLQGEDHPRSRGEYATATWQLWHGYGSSPLSRGIR